MKEPFEISQEVKAALNRGLPVVALESSVIAQGLPAPKGAEAAIAMMQDVRAEECVPAVIGLIEGTVKIGLSEDEIKRLSESETAMKVSTRDLALAITTGSDGGTTVAATAFLAANAGISVMATGGIGGVHRGAIESWDISADMWEMVRTPGLIVCSGAKAVLDIPATMEWLETHQVPVYGYQTEDLPAFYSRTSGLKVPKLDSPEAMSEIMTTRVGLGLRSAVVLAVPIPEQDELDLYDAIEQAVAAAKAEGVSGAALTPWLLSRVLEISGGKSVEANIALLKNNARVAAQVAAAIGGRNDKRIGFVVE